MEVTKMKTSTKAELQVRNDRSIWIAVASIITTCVVASSASAQIIYESPTVPAGTILASQLTDLGPGTQDNNRDYANNQGPAGQTFQVTTAGTANSVSIMGRGDSASSWTTGPQPFLGNETWVIQLGSVNPVTGAITVIDQETDTGFASAGPNISDFVNFDLANPVSLVPGVTYEWTVSVDNSAHSPWIGCAHSSGDAYAGGYAMNNDTSIANPGGANGGATPVMGGYAAPNPGNYDYVFAVESVPEPTALALIGLGAFGLIAARRRSA